jgi:MFS family permease
MNRWKWVVILLAVFSLAILIVTPLLGWQRWTPHPILQSEWRDLPFHMIFPALERYQALVSSISILFSLYVIGVLILFAVPRAVRRVADKFMDTSGRLVRLALFGFLFASLVLAVSISSALALGTFPLTILLFAMLFSGGIFGIVALSLAIGRGLMRRAGWGHLSPLYALLLGELIIFSLCRIPWAGGVLFAIFSSLGLGAVIASRFGSGQPWSLNILTEEEKK